MRMVIVSNEIPRVQGVCVGSMHRWRQELPSTGFAASPTAKVMLATVMAGLGLGFGFSLPLIGGAALQALLRSLESIRDAAFRTGVEAGRRLVQADELEQLETMFDIVVSNEPSDRPSHAFPFEDDALSVLVRGSDPDTLGIPYSSKLFQGSFTSDEQLMGVLRGDGGNSRIHVMNRDCARRHLRRIGGGILEDGVYVLHPKRDDTLVPLRTYHTDLLQEMAREIRTAMSLLGAKRLSIETIEGVSFGGKVVSRVPLKSGAVAADAELNRERFVSFEWASPTFDPDAALENCVWIQDNASAMTIVDQRRRTDLTRFEEYSNVDTSFKLSIDLMKLFQTDFAWKSSSTYKYVIEFFASAAGGRETRARS